MVTFHNSHFEPLTLFFNGNAIEIIPHTSQNFWIYRDSDIHIKLGDLHYNLSRLTNHVSFDTKSARGFYMQSNSRPFKTILE